MSVETWMGLVGTLLTVGVTILLWWLDHRRLDKLIKQLHDESKRLTRLLTEAKGEIRDLREKLGLKEQEFADESARRKAVEIELEATRERAEKLRCALTRTHNLIRRAIRLDGQTWVADIMAGTRRFRRLGAERRVPIISTLNLKGGVGKTTLTAYLGMALARRGYRVLFVDFDLQGSLSGMLVPDFEANARQLDKDGKLLRHLFEAAARDRTTKAKDYIQPIPGTKCGVIATTDGLAYAEMSLTVQWLLRVGHPSHQWDGRRDVRFILRQVLQMKSLTRKFDLILLDCPPLINLACVNALAASDYVLIPVTCSRKSAERVPTLLDRVVEIQKSVNPELKVLGMVANRTWSGSSLSSAERNLWNRLVRSAHDTFGEEIYSFNQPVPDRTDIRDAEDSFVMPEPGSELGQVFARLAEEVEGKLPHDCRRSTETPVQPG